MCAQEHIININFDEFGGLLLVDLVQMQGAYIFMIGGPIKMHHTHES